MIVFICINNLSELHPITLQHVYFELHSHLTNPLLAQIYYWILLLTETIHRVVDKVFTKGNVYVTDDFLLMGWGVMR